MNFLDDPDDAASDASPARSLRSGDAVTEFSFDGASVATEADAAAEEEEEEEEKEKEKEMLQEDMLDALLDDDNADFDAAAAVDAADDIELAADLDLLDEESEDEVALAADLEAEAVRFAREQAADERLAAEMEEQERIVKAAATPPRVPTTDGNGTPTWVGSAADDDTMGVDPTRDPNGWLAAMDAEEKVAAKLKKAGKSEVGGASSSSSSTSASRRASRSEKEEIHEEASHAAIQRHNISPSSYQPRKMKKKKTKKRVAAHAQSTIFAEDASRAEAAVGSPEHGTAAAKSITPTQRRKSKSKSMSMTASTSKSVMRSNKPRARGGKNAAKAAASTQHSKATSAPKSKKGAEPEQVQPTHGAAARAARRKKHAAAEAASAATSASATSASASGSSSAPPTAALDGDFTDAIEQRRTEGRQYQLGQLRARERRMRRVEEKAAAKELHEKLAKDREEAAWRAKYSEKSHKALMAQRGERARDALQMRRLQRAQEAKEKKAAQITLAARVKLARLERLAAEQRRLQRLARLRQAHRAPARMPGAVPGSRSPPSHRRARAAHRTARSQQHVSPMSGARSPPAKGGHGRAGVKSEGKEEASLGKKKKKRRKAKKKKSGKSEDVPILEGWKAVKDKASGRTYYFNKTTRETSWTLPQATTPGAVDDDGAKIGAETLSSSLESSAAASAAGAAEEQQPAELSFKIDAVLVWLMGPPLSGAAEMSRRVCADMGGQLLDPAECISLARERAIAGEVGGLTAAELALRAYLLSDVASASEKVPPVSIVSALLLDTVQHEAAICAAEHVKSWSSDSLSTSTLRMLFVLENFPSSLKALAAYTAEVQAFESRSGGGVGKWGSETQAANVDSVSISLATCFHLECSEKTTLVRVKQAERSTPTPRGVAGPKPAPVLTETKARALRARYVKQTVPVVQKLPASKVVTLDGGKSTNLVWKRIETLVTELGFSRVAGAGVVGAGVSSMSTSSPVSSPARNAAGQRSSPDASTSVEMRMQQARALANARAQLKADGKEGGSPTPAVEMRLQQARALLASRQQL
jgi:hypothetical protein